ncbi:MAG: hypothetical protein WAZ18_07345 [Alphaproteobacteria bacterium]
MNAAYVTTAIRPLHDVWRASAGRVAVRVSTSYGKGLVCLGLGGSTTSLLFYYMGLDTTSLSAGLGLLGAGLSGGVFYYDQGFDLESAYDQGRGDMHRVVTYLRKERYELPEFVPNQNIRNHMKAWYGTWRAKVAYQNASKALTRVGLWAEGEELSPLRHGLERRVAEDMRTLEVGIGDTEARRFVQMPSNALSKLGVGQAPPSGWTKDLGSGYESP